MRTRRQSSSVHLIAALTIFLLFVPIIAAAQCPANRVTVSGTSSGQLVFLVTDEASEPLMSVSYSNNSAWCDLKAGRLSASAWVYEANEHRSEVIAADVFEIHGSAMATFTIRLHLSFTYTAGFLRGFPGGDGRVEALGRYAETTFDPVTRHLDSPLDIEVTATEGVPFIVLYQASASGYGFIPTADMNARLEFVDLPDGVTITSCYGFESSTLPVKETSWGSVKALYR